MRNYIYFKTADEQCWILKDSNNIDPNEYKFTTRSKFDTMGKAETRLLNFADKNNIKPQKIEL
jgi:hypothetical protein